MGRGVEGTEPSDPATALAAPALSPLARLSVRVGPPVVVESGTAGRRFIPIIGGEVQLLAASLAGVSGSVLPGGGDWQDVTAEGRLEIDAHYLLQIDGHGSVEVRSLGVRDGPPEVLGALGRGESVDPSLYYFRTFVRLRTQAPGLARLNGRLAVAIGARRLDAVELTVFEVG